jgi:Pentapeptide repeats (8 copies)
VHSESSSEPGPSASPLTRADIELLLRRGQPATPVDLSFHDLQQCNLSYLNLHGANLRGANLQGANLRGTNLSLADLQEANLSLADLDGADLSGACLGEHEAKRVVLHRTKLSYTVLRGLDLRGFDLSGLDLQCADLNGTDLRHAVLRGTNLQGADLSTAQLHGPELRGAILHRDELWRARGKQADRNKPLEKQLPQTPLKLIQAKPSPPPETEQQPLSDREAFLIGEHAWLVDADPVKIRWLFPQGFTFAHAHYLFDAWLAQTGTSYTEREIQAIWIGFAHRLCLLYHELSAEV